MDDTDQQLEHNRAAWDRMADEGDRLYHAVTPEAIEKARAGEMRIIVTPTKPVPMDWLMPIAGRDILCLAGGGGQQAPLLAAAGANITVLDLSEKQLQRDLDVAAREGLTIKTIASDMRDLSQLQSDSFDLILNPTSNCYCPDVRPVWKEAFRVLRPGGKLIAGFIKPVYYLFDAQKMDRGKLKVRHKIPYSDLHLDAAEREQTLGDRPLEYGHSLTEQIGGQTDAGFEIISFYEDRWGDADVLSDHIDVFAATLAMKPNPISKANSQ